MKKWFQSAPEAPPRIGVTARRYMEHPELAGDEVIAVAIPRGEDPAVLLYSLRNEVEYPRRVFEAAVSGLLEKEGIVDDLPHYEGESYNLVSLHHRMAYDFDELARERISDLRRGEFAPVVFMLDAAASAGHPHTMVDGHYADSAICRNAEIGFIVYEEAADVLVQHLKEEDPTITTAELTEVCRRSHRLVTSVAKLAGTAEKTVMQGMRGYPGEWLEYVPDERLVQWRTPLQEVPGIDEYMPPRNIEGCPALKGSGLIKKLWIKYLDVAEETGAIEDARRYEGLERRPSC